MIHTPEMQNTQLVKEDLVTHTGGKQIITGLHAQLIKRQLRLHTFKLALKHYGWSAKLFRVLKLLKEKQVLVHGKNVMNKWVTASGKKFFYLYAPGFYKGDKGDFLTGEMNRIEANAVAPRLLRLAFFAITNKCPMRCEHCFEWDNLNKKEVLSFEDLRTVVLKLKDAGISQLHLSGGEPMLRADDIVSLAKEFSGDMEIWIVTSGFNVTRENVAKLKAAGVTGFEVSLDHYSKSEHDKFRGFENAFGWATNAIRFAREADLPVCASVCCTREFTTSENLYNYLELTKHLNCSFVQLLEPKAVGHFAGKDVKLDESQLQLLSKFYEDISQSPQFKEYPIVVYHGYYNRKVGCFSAGNRSLYVDTRGEIMSCPFCHLSWGNMLCDDLKTVIAKMRTKGCGDFGSGIG